MTENGQGVVPAEGVDGSLQATKKKTGSQKKRKQKRKKPEVKHGDTHLAASRQDGVQMVQPSNTEGKESGRPAQLKTNMQPKKTNRKIEGTKSKEETTLRGQRSVNLETTFSTMDGEGGIPRNVTPVNGNDAQKYRRTRKNGKKRVNAARTLSKGLLWKASPGSQRRASVVAGPLSQG
jgi:hypothetical protein